MKIGRLDKDPNSTVDIVVDWIDWLTSPEQIASVESVVEPAGSLSIESQSNTSSQHTLWLKGGAVGKTYRIISRITTSNATPRIQDATVDVVIGEQ